MQHCTPKTATPCFQHHRDRPEALDEFLVKNGGNPAEYDAAGTAVLYSNLKGEMRMAYLKHGYWLRCLGPAQFSACSDSTFQETYQLVEVNIKP